MDEQNRVAVELLASMLATMDGKINANARSIQSLVKGDGRSGAWAKEKQALLSPDGWTQGRNGLFEKVITVHDMPRNGSIVATSNECCIMSAVEVGPSEVKLTLLSVPSSDFVVKFILLG